MGVGEWVDRIVDLTTPESIQMFGMDDALELTLEEPEFKKAPKEAIELARERLASLTS